MFYEVKQWGILEMSKEKLKVDKIRFIDPDVEEAKIPDQKEFYQLPARFGAIPLDEAPLGWEVETRRREIKITKFEHAYPKIRLPFQEVHREEFGHNDKFEKTPLFPNGANRLFFGDNLHIMRQLPSNSIDLIYIDPPFFSGRNYNVIFGDNNEIRSFSDIWQGGMPGYLIWLNARLFEMKRLVKSTGSIVAHCDWHASHYIKVEMDKIFGYGGDANSPGFRNEIIHCYRQGGRGKNIFPRKHDTILWYSKTNKWVFNGDPIRIEYHGTGGYISKGRNIVGGKEYKINPKGKIPEDWWDIPALNPEAKERIGYPTQKPRALLERIILAFSNEGDVIADFFVGGGTTPAVAQQLDRRWIACDQSRIAVAITADRIRKVIEDTGNLFAVPDFVIEHWGIYEIPELEKLPPKQFREFIVKAYGGRPENIHPKIHGARRNVPIYVGSASQRSQITKKDVAEFAQAIWKERHSNFGTMLGWNFSPDARKASQILAARENKRIDFVRLSLVRLEDDEFNEHVRTKHPDYKELLSFVQPPEVRIYYERKESCKYVFDASESVSLNKDGEIANIQWDFDFKNRFTTTAGYSFLRDKETGKPQLIVEYQFPKTGKFTIACSVQDNQGGEKTEILAIEVE